MAVRVYTDVAATAGSRGYNDYPDAPAYHVDDEHELDVLAASGSILATYPPGKWHHVEIRKDG
jgi:hypothetical protein